MAKKNTDKNTIAQREGEIWGMATYYFFCPVCDKSYSLQYDASARKRFDGRYEPHTCFIQEGQCRFCETTLSVAYSADQLGIVAYDDQTGVGKKSRQGPEAEERCPEKEVPATRTGDTGRRRAVCPTLRTAAARPGAAGEHRLLNPGRSPGAGGQTRATACRPVPFPAESPVQRRVLQPPAPRR